jgi:hypothetical protein
MVDRESPLTYPFVLEKEIYENVYAYSAGVISLYGRLCS